MLSISQGVARPPNRAANNSHSKRSNKNGAYEASEVSARSALECVEECESRKRAEHIPRQSPLSRVVAGGQGPPLFARPEAAQAKMSLSTIFLSRIVLRSSWRT